MTNTEITLDPWSFNFLVTLWDVEEHLADAADTIELGKVHRLMDASSAHLISALEEILGEKLGNMVMERTADGYTLPEALHECGVRVPGVDLQWVPRQPRS